MKKSETLRMELGERSYDIVVERGALDRASEMFDLDRKVMIVTDRGVPCEYVNKVTENVSKVSIFVADPGEDSKTLDTLKSILGQMLYSGFTRRDCVVAVGGGMVGDLAGFAAATYMRGIDFYNIPTTVLSQVDSSIGGKTAVNLDGIKNAVGAFYQPKKVLIDLDTLDTLDERLVSEGLAEALKMGLTSDKELFEIFEEGNIKENMDEIIIRSLKVKKDVVERDERETWLRKILNFGHTIGHGIESLGGLYHGECVAVGMIPMVGDELRPRLISILEKLGLPTYVEKNAADIYKSILHDKKSTEDGVDAVLVPEIGSYEIRFISFEELCPMIKTITR